MLPLLRVVNPATQASLLTTSRDEAVLAARYGFGVPVEVGRVWDGPSTGLTAVHRLYRQESRDFVAMPPGAELVAATGVYTVQPGDSLWRIAEQHRGAGTRWRELLTLTPGLDPSGAIEPGDQVRVGPGLGYVDQSIDAPWTRWYASTRRTEGLVPMYRLLRGQMHRHALAAELPQLRADGWLLEGEAFYVAPWSALARETVTVWCDTQSLTYQAGGLDAIVDHVIARSRVTISPGDKTAAPYSPMLERSAAATARMVEAGVLVVEVEGNHEAWCVRPDGDVRDPATVVQDLRDISRWQAAVGGQLRPDERMAPSSSSNAVWLTSIAGMPAVIVTLEPWPRAAARAWARGVLAAHRDRLGILVTHVLVDAGGAWYPRQEYGACRPIQIWEDVLAPSSNVVLALCGHVGDVARRVDTRPDGTACLSINTTIHPGGGDRPVRELTFDRDRRLIEARVVDAVTGGIRDAYSWPVPRWPT